MIITNCNCDLFGNTRFRGPSEFTKLNATAGERRDVYYHEQNIIVIDVDNKNQTIRCELIEV